MKPVLPLALSAFTALLFAGCESTGISARIQEKSATYAALVPEQQELVQSGKLELGFTSDMVYLALGKPAKVETKETKDGPFTVWSYTRFYPTEAAAKTWSVSIHSPATFYVFFYQDKVFKASLEQERKPADIISFANTQRPMGRSARTAAGIYSNGVPPISAYPGVKP